MNVFYKSLQMPERFMDAVEVIMEYCQNEDCIEDCVNCPCSLTEIRCGDNEEIEEEILSNGCQCWSCKRIITDGKIFPLKKNPKKGLCFKCY